MERVGQSFRRRRYWSDRKWPDREYQANLRVKEGVWEDFSVLALVHNSSWIPVKCCCSASLTQRDPAQATAPGLGAVIGWCVFVTASLYLAGEHIWGHLSISQANEFSFLGTDHSPLYGPQVVWDCGQILATADWCRGVPHSQLGQLFPLLEICSCDHEKQAFSIVSTIMCKLWSWGVAIYCPPRK